ncbi:unnamed protein product [Plutella xylostella]|uniref:(diamondback moth) hypothetical protein n=1 Tax=Plutella xylostella TaxID=51655 RepID=A0A8S4DA60_PLUXY|nr:unnamed protein product [Plutella xylostella]
MLETAGHVAAVSGRPRGGAAVEAAAAARRRRGACAGRLSPGAAASAQLRGGAPVDSRGALLASDNRTNPLIACESNENVNLAPSSVCLPVLAARPGGPRAAAAVAAVVCLRIN